MKKKLLVLSILTVILYQLSAQTINWGKLYPEGADKYGLGFNGEVFGPIGNSFFEAVKENGEVTIKQYNFNGNLLKQSKPTQFSGIEGKDLTFDLPKKIGSRWYLMIFEHNKKINSTTAFAAEVTENGVSSKPFRLFTFKGMRSAFNSLYSYDKKYVYSENNSLITYISREKAGSADNLVITVSTLDTTLSLISQHTYDIKLPVYKIFFEAAAVSNKGEVYLLAKHMEKRNNVSSMNTAFFFELYSLKSGNLSVQKLSLENERTFERVVAFVNSQDELLLAGYYKEKSASERHTNGLFTVVSNTSNSAVKVKFFPFSNALMSGLQSAKDEIKENNLQTIDITLSEIMPDGSLAIVGREYYDNTSGMIYNDGYIITRVSFKGEFITQSKIISPIGTGTRTNAEEASAYVTGNKINILFNSVVSKNGGKKASAIAQFCIIDELGATNCNEVFSSSDDFFVQPQILLALGGNKFVVRKSNLKECSYGILTN